MMKTTAIINAWFPDRNYGFLHELKDGKVVKHFLHHSNIVSGTPRKDCVAHFDSVVGDRGSIALNVQIFESQESLQRYLVTEVLSAAAPATEVR